MQAVKSARLPTTLLLPILCLLQWVCFVAIPITLEYAHLLQGSHGLSVIRLTTGPFTATVPREDFFRFAANAPMRYEHLLKVSNLPALALDLLTSRLASSWPENATPRGVDTQAWQSITYPLYCLPFWCFLGFGIDRLRAKQRMSWPALLFGTVLFTVCALLLLGFTFGISGSDPQDGKWIVEGFGLWAALFALFPLAWAAQWRAVRQSSRASNLR